MPTDDTYRGLGGERAMPWKAFILTFVFFIFEVALWVMFYSVFNQVLGPLSDEPLALLPMIGPAFDALDSQMSVADLLSAILAFVSVILPIFLWAEILKQEIHKDPIAWLDSPLNRAIAIVAALVFLLVFAMEAVCLYFLIAQHDVPSVLIVGDKSETLEFLAANKALGIVVSVGLAILNAVVALITVKSARDLNSNW